MDESDAATRLDEYAACSWWNRAPRMARAKAILPSGKIVVSQIQRMQADMARTQAKLARQMIEPSHGSGNVRVAMTGAHECRSITIEFALPEAGDVVMPQDVKSRAGNQAIRRLQQLAARRLGPIAEMMAL